ncbi:hypothetical protein E3U25_03655 (plasmid) [Paracoccus versutus]|uniref:CRISPR type IV-associated protein Csf3 n=1 Tax=Paracoccus versutus TaxID=34007 RepID=A0A3D9XTJ0_PARVE|nr:CRISPR type IV-associated protein Csf3 [Paracoccus versutus]WGR55128.1 hypothetical protein E3U25_03655 [Paracoccus versutus]
MLVALPHPEKQYSGSPRRISERDVALFRITAYLGTPVCLGKTYLTLDAILYGILAEMREVRRVDTDPIKDIPLRQVDGLFLSSRAYFNNPVHHGEIKTGGVRLAKDLADTPLFLQPSRDRYYKVNTTNGPLKAHLTRYQCIAAQSVSWIAEGDAAKVQRLLESADGIGARRKEGYGVLRRIELESADGLSPLLDEKGEARRPIPVRFSAHSAPATASLTAVDTWRPPYWDASNAEECHIPRPA